MAINFLSHISVAGQILTPAGHNLALNPNTGTVSVGGILDVNGTGTSTFAGDLTVSKAGAAITINSTSGTQGTLHIGRGADTKAKITSGDTAASDLCLYTNGTRALTILSDQNATFAGTVTAPNLSATTAVYSGGIVYGSTTLNLKNNTGTSFVDFASGLGATFAGDVNTLGDVHIDEGSTSGHQTSNKVRFGHTSWNNNMGIESYWMVLGCNQNEGFKFRDSTNNIILQLQGNNNSSGNGALSATFAGTIASGAITSTGQITGTELEGTSLDINGNGDVSGNLNVTGNITNATWTGDVIASSYLDSDTAHLGETQTFTGSKTFSGNANVTSNLYANRYIQNATGVPTNNLGGPTVTEMALFESQFKPQTTLANNYNNLDDLTFWSKATSNASWTEVTSYSDDIKRKFLRTNNSSVIIPNDTYAFRVEFVAHSYTFANAMYMYWSSNSHNSTVHAWKRRCSDDVWIQHTDSATTISSWPGHGYLPFGTIPWHETNDSSTGHYNKIRIEFTPNWSGHETYGDRDINIYGMQIWGGYPTGRRTVHSYNQDGKLDLFKDLGLPDNGVATFGNSDDLEIYHDGSNSYVKESGTGDLILQGTNLKLKDGSGNNFLFGTNNGNVTLGHAGSTKFETKSDGVDITGELQADSLDIDGDGDVSGTLTIGTISATDYGLASGDIPNNAANTTGSAYSLSGSAGSLLTAPSTGELLYTGPIGNGTTGLFAASDNSNSIITLNRHFGDYDSQLGFSSNGNIYYRKFSGTAINDSQVWYQVYHSGNIIPSADLDADTAHLTTTQTFTGAKTFTANVGIGTNAPNKSLTVVGGNIAMVGGSAQGNFFMPLSTGNGDGGFMFSSDPNNATQNYGTGVVGSMFFKSGDGFHVSATGAYSLTDFAIKTDGKVGIGTTSPGAKLDVTVDDIGISTFAQFGSTTIDGSTREGGIKLFSSSGSTDKTFAIWKDANAPNALRFEYLGTRGTAFGSGTDVMVMQSDGNVGIGTTTPGYKLEIAEDTDGTADLLFLRNSDSTYAQTWAFQSDTNKDLVITGSSSAGGVKFVPGSRGVTVTGTLTATLSGTATGLAGTPNISVGTIACGNITTTGYLRGPASFTIDPVTHGDDTGTVVIAGNLQVDGTTTTINSTTVAIDDLNFSIATDAADSAAANGAGITIGGAGATLLYTHAAVGTGSWDVNKHFNVTGGKVAIVPNSGAYDQLKIASNLTANTNKMAGIYTENYVGNNTSIMQYATNSGGNTVYYGSADGNYRGITGHRFYVNASPTATTGHTQALYIAGDTNATFAGDVILGTGDSLYLNGTTGLRMLHDGSNALFINQTAGDFKIQNSVSDKDIIFKGKDGSSTITALTLDMSDAGAAYFNDKIYIPSYIAHTGDPDSLFGFSGNDTFIINTAGTTALTINSSQNATFAGDVQAASIGSDGTAKSYTWSLSSTSSNDSHWYKIARVTSTQSCRFKLQMVGGHSYSDGIFSSEVNAYGQLNNDNNYDLTFYQLEKDGQSGSPVISFGQVDVDTVSTDLYVQMNTYAELAITASISKGDLYPDSTSTGNDTTPTNFVAATEQFGILSNASFRGTIASGAITSTGKITGTELEGTSLDINGAADISGALVVHNQITGTELEGTSLDMNGSADISGDLTVHGKITQSGYVDYEKYGRSYTVNTNAPLPILTSDGSALPVGGGYRVTGHIAGTGTEQVAMAVFWNENGTWNINKTFEGGTSSNHVEFKLLDHGSGSVPTVTLESHASNYNVLVYHERLSLDEGTGNDNLRGYFGADSYLSWLESTNTLTIPGALASGAITSTGQITGTELEGTSLDINGDADISGDLTGVDDITASGNILGDRFILPTTASAANQWIYTNNNHTGTGSLIIQAGEGSAGYGGGLRLYSHAHASLPGWVKAGISSGSGGKFSVNTYGTGGGTDVFTVDASGNSYTDGIVRSRKNIVSNAIYNVMSLNSSRTQNDYGGLNKDYMKIDLETPGAATDGEGSNHHYGSFSLKLANNGSNTNMTEVLNITKDGNATFAGNIRIPSGNRMEFGGASTGGGADVLASGTDLIVRASDDIHFRTSGDTDAMSIIQNQYVGVGTTSPGGKLHIAKNSQTYTDGTSYGFLVGDLTTSAKRVGIGYDAGNDVGFIQSLQHGVVVKNLALNPNGGNVGIGTTSPSKELHIKSSAPRVLIEGTGASAEDAEISRISGLWDGTYVADIQFLAGDDTSNKDNGKIAFRTYTSDGTVGTRMLIEEAGNVGIGTSSPAEKLEVYNAGTSYIKVNSDATAPYIAGIEFSRSSVNKSKIYNDGGSVQLKFESNYAPDEAHPTYGGFQFKTAPVTTGTLVDAVRIDGYGNMGIGTTSPNQLLSVKGANAPIGLYDTQTNAATRNWALRINDVVYGDFSIFQSNALGGDPIAAGTRKFYIKNDGKVGIGNASPGSALHVTHGTSADLLTLERTDVTQKWALKIQGTTGDEFKIRDVTRSADRLTIDANGNIGVGTTTPGRPLTINSATAEGHAIRILENDSANESWDIGVDVDGDLNFFNSADANPTVAFLDNGNATFAGNIVMANSQILYSDDIRASTGGMIIGPTGESDLILRTHAQTALTIDGSTRAATFAGDVTVSGGLTINGTTTTINTTTVEVEDNILQLNTTQASPDTATAATSGISVYRGDGITQASLIFDDADDTWDLTNNLTVAGNVIAGTNHITAASFYVQGTYPRIYLADTDSNDDYSIINNNGTFLVYNDTDSSIPLAIAGDNTATFAGIITTGNRITLSSGGNATSARIDNSGNYLLFQAKDSDAGQPQFWMGNDSDTGVYVNAGQHYWRDLSSNNMAILNSSKFSVTGEVEATSLDINGVADISGDLTVGGTLTTDFISSQIDTTLSGTSTPSTQLTTNYTYTGTNINGAYARVDYLNLIGSGGSFQNTAGYMMKTNVTSTGTSTAIKNIMSRAHTSGSGDINNVAMFVTHNEFEGSGNVGTWAGLAIADIGGSFSNTQTVTSTYGIKIGDITHGEQTNAPYAIHTGSERVHFGGNLNVDGTTTLEGTQIDDTLTVGVNGTGHDVKFFGDTAGSYVLWDESDDALEFVNSSLSITGGNGSQLNITSGNVAWDASINLDTGEANGQWRIAAEGSDESFQIANIDQGGTSALSIHPTTKATTFAGKVRANSWFQGADGTNTLWASTSEGVLIETPGSTSDNNDSKIYFRNSGNIVKHTFDTNNGNATFAGNITTTGNINAGSAKYLRFTSAASSSDATVLFGNTSGTGGSLTFKRNSDSATILTLNGDKSTIFAGNIGLGGATSPSRLLHIDNSSSTSTAGAYIYTNAQHTGTDTQAHVSIRSDHASSTGDVLYVRGDGTGNLLTLDKGGSDKLVVDDDGNATFAGTVTGGNGTFTNLTVNTVAVGPTDGSNGRILHGTKTQALTDGTYTTVLTINLSTHKACYVKIFATCDWNSHSAVQFLGEYFITNGADGYNEPGMIIREVDNTKNDTIVSKIVDPDGSGTRDFLIQLLADDNVGTSSPTAKITYEVMGDYTSVS